MMAKVWGHSLVVIELEAMTNPTQSHPKTANRRKGLFGVLLLAVLAGLVFYQVSFKPFRQYWDLVGTVQDDLSTLHLKRPMNVDAEQWEDAVGWTSNIFGNVSMMTSECDLAFLHRFHSSLQTKIDQGVDLDTLKWIWDELAKAGPRAADYAFRYRPVHLMVNEPITDEMLPTLWGIDHCRVIDLSGSKITDQGLVHLKHLRKAEFIYLHNSKVTKEGVAELQEALPDCKISHED